MSKALNVLAECVDARSGKRFKRGDVFDPAPNPEQARRLIKAGCLPETALEVAVAAEAEVEKAAEKKAATDRADEEARLKAEAEAKAKADDEAKKAAEKKA